MRGRYLLALEIAVEDFQPGAPLAVGGEAEPLHWRRSTHAPQ